MGEFVGMHFTEAMIDHLEIESIVHHIESEEAKMQIKAFGMPALIDGNSNSDFSYTMTAVLCG